MPEPTQLPAQIQADVAAVQRIDAIPTLLDIVCRITGMGFAAVARVTEDRWVTCSLKDEIGFGLKPGDELELETTICNEIRESGIPVAIDQVSQDDAFRHHRTPARYGFESYISMPIFLRSGAFFGTLCAIDPRPAQVSRPEVVGMFRMFAELIAFHLDAQERLARSEASLVSAEGAAELREQFVAVLGHDLRNPLAAIASGVRLLGSDPAPERATKVLQLMTRSVDRMAALIENVLDFARGRLGGGLGVMQRPADLTAIFTQVADELRAGHPDRTVETAFSLPPGIECDGSRLGQLASNLIGNALTHGAADQPIRIDGRIEVDRLHLDVSNGGKQLPAAAIDRLFRPFERGAVRPGQNGLGLGLYIAAEIAKAHGGTLTATSSPTQTTFTFEMPLKAEVGSATDIPADAE